MAFRLPRLRDEQITDGNRPTPLYRRWWQSVVEQTEDAVNGLESVLDGLTGVEGSLTGLQAQDDKLDGLAAMDSSTGLVEQTGADTFAKRTIGVASATDIPTRGNADARYLRGDGAITAAAAVASTHKMAFVDPVSGTTYYVLLTT